MSTGLSAITGSTYGIMINDGSVAVICSTDFGQPDTGVPPWYDSVTFTLLQ